jgi:TRAP-type uncharacterized transport system fused permease subunit
MTTERKTMRVGQKYSYKRERRRLQGLWWGVVLIWAGLVFGADSLGRLPEIGEADAWSLIFVGAGTLGVLGAFYRSISPRVPNPTTWDWVWAGFCLIIGLGGFTRLSISWPLILILVGGLILLDVLRRRD